jgi:iron complex transport system substrate-binding protein
MSRTTRHTAPRRRLVVALAATTALALGACSSDDQAADDTGVADVDVPDDATSAPEFPVTLGSGTGQVTIEEEPERIVSLSPSATEILFAIGAGDQVVATDEYSTYPAEAPTTDLSGFEPNIEAIAGYEPDLVVAASDTSDLVASLEALDIPVLLNPAPPTVEEGFDGMAALGIATGNATESDALVEDLRAEIEAAYATAPDLEEPLRVYHELDDTFFAASSFGFIGSVYAELGAENIADEADTARSGFPQLTEEAVIAADPQLIVITDQVSYTADDVADRPGWDGVSAVRSDSIVTVDADIASRWGPRLPQLITAVASAMDAAPVPVG